MSPLRQSDHSCVIIKHPATLPPISATKYCPRDGSTNTARTPGKIMLGSSASFSVSIAMRILKSAMIEASSGVAERMCSVLSLIGIKKRCLLHSRLAWRDVFQPRMLIRQLRRPPALTRPRHQRCLKQIRLDHILQRVALLSHGGGHGVDSGRPTVVNVDQRAKKGAVLLIQSQRINPLH